MKSLNSKYTFLIVWIFLFTSSCVPDLTVRDSTQSLPDEYATIQDTSNLSSINWKDYFDDPYLIALIDTALSNNQELNIFMQEMDVLKNEVRIRKGEYLPFVDIGAGSGIDKVGRYTRMGALEANNEIRPGEEFPEPLPDFFIGAYASWEIDIWKRLRNAKKSALLRYLASGEGRNFLVTNLVAEVSSAYYELLALDRQLEITVQNIEIQTDALETVKVQKQSAKVTELAVKRFAAQLAGTISLKFDIQQRIIEVENEINFLLGRFPQPIVRSVDGFDSIEIDSVGMGIPSQLLENRPDIRQAELELSASKLDVKVAKADFYPRLDISASFGYQAFNPKFLLTSPQSIMFGFAGELMAPLVNRNGIKAQYYSANARQLRAAISYEQTVLNAYVEVVNQISRIRNLGQSYRYRLTQVQQLNESIEIANNLFRSARADYVEVLLTQEEALESRFELVETRMMQLMARVDVYRSLGGGWQ